MDRRTSGSIVVNPQPEGPRFRAKRREFEQGSRTNCDQLERSKTRAPKRNLRPSGFPASVALAGFLHAKTAVGLEAGVDQEFAGLTLRGHAVLCYLS